MKDLLQSLYTGFFSYKSFLFSTRRVKEIVTSRRAIKVLDKIIKSITPFLLVNN